jgi:hypothetical protein
VSDGAKEAETANKNRRKMRPTRHPILNVARQVRQYLRVGLAALIIAPVSACYTTKYLGDPPLDEAKAYFSGFTTRTYSFSHGTQISYNAPDGRTYLWYPGNSVVLPGLWYVLEEKPIRAAGIEYDQPVVLPRNSICFAYGPNTYNPVTRLGGGLECMRTTLFQERIGERQAGDVFGLATRQLVPFILSKSPTSIDALMLQARR